MGFARPLSEFDCMTQVGLISHDFSVWLGETTHFSGGGYLALHGTGGAQFGSGKPS